MKKILILISSAISSYLAIIVLVIALLSFFIPSTFLWISPKSINWMLGLVMFGMGLNLNPQEFKVVFMRPKEVLLGCLAQFTIMPFLAWVLTKVFSLPPEMAIGVILVGACPGGTSSNVITYLAKGDLALSVGMTGVSTIIAPLMTPLITWMLAGQMVDVDAFSMFLSIVQVVIAPIALGFIIKHFFPRFTQSVVDFLPSFSTIIIAAIVGIVVSRNAESLHKVGLLVILVVILHNLCGYALGYIIGRLACKDHKKNTAIAIEVGMQNSGLACSLAQQHFSSLANATVPGAIFSVWHNISGAIVAKLFSRNTK